MWCAPLNNTKRLALCDNGGTLGHNTQREKTKTAGHMIYLIALSSNVASPRLDPKDIISQALWLFSGEGLHQRTVSDLFLAPMLPEGEGPDYLTSVAVIETEWPLGDLALRLRKIEAALGDHGPNSGGARVLRLETIGPWPATSRDLMALRGAGQAAL